MKCTPRNFLLLLVFCLSFSGLTQAQVKTLREVVKELQGIPSGEEDFPFGEVPLLAQQLLPEMKRYIRQEIIDAVVDDKNATATPQALREVIVRNLQASGIQLDPYTADDHRDEFSALYGRLLELQVLNLPGHTDLLEFQTTVSIPCGNDSSLYIFQRKDSRWRLILGREQDSYTMISDARGSFQFQISPSDDYGEWFVVTADINPWCTSNWQGLRYEVLRPSFTPDRPNVLFAEERGVYLGVDHPFSLSVRKDGFEIRHSGSQSLDAGLLVREHVENYAVQGDFVTRIPPLALKPEDFLDEWIGLPWQAAQSLIVGTGAENLRKWHSELGARSSAFATELDFVQPCSPKANVTKWQIGLSLESVEKTDSPAGVPKELYFSVLKRGDRFLVERVAAARSSGCPGNTKPEAPF